MGGRGPQPNPSCIWYEGDVVRCVAFGSTTDIVNVEDYRLTLI